MIEAHQFAGRNDLVDLTMTDLTLYREDAGNTPVEPTWDIGTEAGAGDHIHYGTKRLQRYRIAATNSNSTLTFKKSSRINQDSCPTIYASTGVPR